MDGPPLHVMATVSAASTARGTSRTTPPPVARRVLRERRIEKTGRKTLLYRRLATRKSGGVTPQAPPPFQGLDLSHDAQDACTSGHSRNLTCGTDEHFYSHSKEEPA